ncbi:MAG: ETC complex I subunit [Sphingopyxis sp.]
MAARIYQIPKNAMQSGRARGRGWVLEHCPTEARRADPLMGWSGSGDTQAQVRLSFDSLEAARSFALHQGIDAHVIATPSCTLKIQAYADNFR